MKTIIKTYSRNKKVQRFEAKFFHTKSCLCENHTFNIAIFAKKYDDEERRKTSRLI